MSSFSTESNSDSDLPLVKALQGGDESSLNRIMEKYRDPLFRFIYRYVQHEEDASDILQETFVRAYFKISQFKPKARFVTWLFQIAVNLCKDHARRIRRRPVTQEYFSDEEKSGKRKIEEISGETQDGLAKYQVEAEYQTKEEMALLQRGIDKLPHDLRTALILVSLEGRPYAEAAALLKTTEKTVETRIYRAKKILEKDLKSFFNR